MNRYPELLPPESVHEPEDVFDFDALISKNRISIEPRGPLVTGVYAWFMALPIVAQIFVGALFIAGLMYFARLLHRPPVTSTPTRSYAFGARRNTSGVGAPVPVVYGEHVQYGHILMQFVEVEGDVQFAYTLLAMSEGAIQGMSDYRIKDQPISNFQSVYVETRLGTSDQAPIPWFSDQRNTYAVSVNLDNDNDTFVYTTLSTMVDAFIVRLLFPGIAVDCTVVVRVEYKAVADPSYLFAAEVSYILVAGSNPVPKEIRWDSGSGGVGGGALDTGPRSPSAGASETYGALAWTNSGNVFTSNNVYATAMKADVGYALTHFLKVTGFGFNIPSTATILGFQITVERKQTGGSAFDAAVHLVKNGAIVTAKNLATFAFWSAAETVITYGSSSELGGETWTPADVNSALSGVAIAINVAGGSTPSGGDVPGTASIDHVTLRVYYKDTITPPAAGSRRYNVKVTRISTSATPKPQMIWDTIDEITYGSSNFPDIAVMAIKHDLAQASGDVSYSAFVQGRKLRWIDSQNVIQETEVYSRNNALALLDILTHKRYGLGPWVSDSQINLASLKRAVDFCNQQVGAVLEARHMLDLVMDEQLPAYDWLEKMLNTFHAFLIESDETWRVGLDQITAYSQIFDDANIEQGSFSKSWLSLGDEYDQVEVIFYPGDSRNARDSVPYPDLGNKVKSIELRGVTRRTEAMRQARHHFNAITQLSTFVEFNAGIDAVSCDVEDVVYVFSKIHRWPNAGRIMAHDYFGGNSVITVDKNDLPTTGITGYSMIVRHADDTFETKNVISVGPAYLSPEGYTRQDVTIAALLVIPLVRDSHWAFGPSSQIGQKFRLMALTTTEELKRHLVGMEYRDTVYVDTVEFLQKASIVRTNTVANPSANVNIPLIVDGDTVLLFLREDSGAGVVTKVFVSIDRGLTWEVYNITGADVGLYGFVKFTGFYWILDYTNQQIRYSTDGGKTWVVEVGAAGQGELGLNGGYIYRAGGQQHTGTQIARRVAPGIWSTIGGVSSQPHAYFQPIPDTDNEFLLTTGDNTVKRISLGTTITVLSSTTISNRLYSAPFPNTMVVSGLAYFFTKQPASGPTEIWATFNGGASWAITTMAASVFSNQRGIPCCFFIYLGSYFCIITDLDNEPTKLCRLDGNIWNPVVTISDTGKCYWAGSGLNVRGERDVYVITYEDAIDTYRVYRATINV